MILAEIDQQQISRSIQQPQRVIYLSIGETVQAQVRVLGDCLRVVDAHQSFAHHHCLVLCAHRLAVISQYVVET